jgi:hypothetical protein
MRDSDNALRFTWTVVVMIALPLKFFAIPRACSLQVNRRFAIEPADDFVGQ